jgi:uncharacterized protein
MQSETTLFIALVFALAGFVKGVIGLGLPTISMGLLALVMPPVQAAAVLVLPSLLTNVWQMCSGPSIGSAIRRLWPMMLAICAGAWIAAGLMTGAYARYMIALLGTILALYALTGFTVVRLRVSNRSEPWLGPIVGVATGIITAAAGVSVIPSVPYLQAIGLEKDDLIQALGLSFTVSTLALAATVAEAGALSPAVAGKTVVALIAAVAGLLIGRALRGRLQPATFRRWFFIGLLFLGLYLIGGAFR